MFEVGEKVKIVRNVIGKNQKIINYDYDNTIQDENWNNSFMVEMKAFIGFEVTIKTIDLLRNEISFYEIPWSWSILSIDKIKGEEEMKKELLLEMSRDALYALARNKNIPGRGSMTKAELITALSTPIIKKESLGVKLNRLIKENATCHYAYRNGKKEVFHNDDICHARLHAVKMDEIVLNVKKHYDNHQDKQQYRWFVEWMLNESPFSKCFLTKKWKDAYEDGVYLDCNYSISRLAASAIALRGGSEYPASLSLHHKFVKDGYNPALSWFLSYQFKEDEGKWYFSGDGGGGHKVFSVAVADSENMCKFIKEGFHLNPHDEPANQHAQNYRIFKAVHGEDVSHVKSMANTINNIFNIKKAVAFEASTRITSKQFNEGFSKLQEMIFG